MIKKKNFKPEYKYQVSQNEIRYKVLYHLKDEALEEFKRKISENNGFCPGKVERTDATRCMCLEFRNAAHQGPCSCGLYTKKLRTPEQVEKWEKSLDPKYEEKKKAEMEKAEEKLRKAEERKAKAVKE